MPNKSLSRSGLLTYQKYSSLLAGNGPYIPFTSSYDLLETEILTSDTASIEFTSGGVWAGYQHIEIRYALRSNASGPFYTSLKLNSDSGSNYTRHQLVGNGSTVSSFAATSQSNLFMPDVPGSESSADIFNGGVISILDVNETSKYTTVRSLGGYLGGATRISMRTGLWINTAAVTTLTFAPSGGSFLTGSRISIYGLKASA